MIRFAFYAVLCLALSVPVMAAQICNTDMLASTAGDRFVDNGDGTVTDSETDLMWKRCTEGLSGTSCAVGSGGGYTWQQALERAAAITDAGYADWRVPNIKELGSIIERKCKYPAINASIFPNVSNSDLWSSTAYANGASGAWSVDLINGYSNFKQRNESLGLLLVRDGRNFAADVNLESASVYFLDSDTFVVDGMRVDGLGYSYLDDAIRAEYNFNYETRNFEIDRSSISPFFDVGVFSGMFMVKVPAVIQPTFFSHGGEYHSGTDYSFSSTKSEPFVAVFSLEAGHVMSFYIDNQTEDYSFRIVGKGLDDIFLAKKGEPLITNGYKVLEDGEYRVEITPAEVDRMEFVFHAFNSNSNELISLENGGKLNGDFRNGPREYLKYMIKVEAGDSIYLPNSDSDVSLRLVDEVGSALAARTGLDLVYSAENSQELYLFIYAIDGYGGNYSGVLQISPGAVAEAKQGRMVERTPKSGLSAWFDSSVITKTSSGLVFDGARFQGLGYSAVDDALKIRYEVDPSNLNLIEDEEAIVEYFDIGPFQGPHVAKDVDPKQPVYSVDGSYYDFATIQGFSAYRDAPFVAKMSLDVGHVVSFFVDGPSGELDFTFAGSGMEESAILTDPSISRAYLIKHKGEYLVTIVPRKEDVVSFELMGFNGNERNLIPIEGGQEVDLELRANTRDYLKFEVAAEPGNLISAEAPNDGNISIKLINERGKRLSSALGRSLIYNVEESGMYYIFIYNIVAKGGRYSGRVSIE